jgi:hypothetical protein
MDDRCSLLSIRSSKLRLASYFSNASAHCPNACILQMAPVAAGALRASANSHARRGATQLAPSVLTFFGREANDKEADMFTPEILTVPIFSALDGGAVAWPTIGAVLAWMLIAAFVGSGLGVLREALRGPVRTRAAKKSVAEAPLAPVAPAHGCCEAA